MELKLQHMFELWNKYHCCWPQICFTCVKRNEHTAFLCHICSHSTRWTAQLQKHMNRKQNTQCVPHTCSFVHWLQIWQKWLASFSLENLQFSLCVHFSQIWSNFPQKVLLLFCETFMDIQQTLSDWWQGTACYY